MAQLRLTTNERINVVESIDQIKNKILEANLNGSMFLELNQNVNHYNKETIVKTVPELLYVNVNHIVGFY